MWREKAAQESGSSASKKRPSTGDAVEDNEGLELNDTASSPVKTAPPVTAEVDKHPDARKQLVMSGDKEMPPPPPEYKSPREIKRAKRLDSRQEKLATNAEAGSLEECRQQQ
jgi:hypothetical protein